MGVLLVSPRRSSLCFLPINRGLTHPDEVVSPFGWEPLPGKGSRRVFTTQWWIGLGRCVGVGSSAKERFFASHYRGLPSPATDWIAPCGTRVKLATDPFCLPLS